MQIACAPNYIPGGTSGSALYILSLEHNVPGGVHATGVVVTVGAAPAASAGPADPTSPGAIMSSKLFQIGAGTGAGIVVFVLLCSCICYCRYCRNRGAGAAGSGSGGGGQKRGWFSSVGGSAPPRGGFGSAAAGASGASNGRLGGDAKPAADGAKGGKGTTTTSFEYDLSDDDTDDEKQGLAAPGTASKSKRDKKDRRRGGVDDRGLELSSMGGGAPAAAPSSSAATSSGASSSFAAPAGAGTVSRAGSSSSSSSSGGLRLRAKPVLKAAEFESRWAALTTVELWGATLKALPAPGELEKALAAGAILCMASGTVGGVSMYYFYAQEDAPGGEGREGRLCMSEVSITVASLRLSAVIKAPDMTLGLQFVEVFKKTLQPLLT